MKNRELAEIFNRLADSLKFKGDIPFKVNAYRKVARLLTDYPEDIQLTYRENRLQGSQYQAAFNG